MKWLKLPEEKLGQVYVWTYIALAYTFSVWLRLHLGNYTSFDDLQHDGKFINTADGYFFAKGAWDLLFNAPPYISQSPYGSGLSQLAAWIGYVLPVRFETLIFVLPAYFSSLIVVPVVLIGRLLGQTTLGFCAALLSCGMTSYYYRTKAGYFDTDTLSLLLPVLEACIMMLALIRPSKALWPLLILVSLFYQWFYPQSISIHVALYVTAIGYCIFLGKRTKEEFSVPLFFVLGFLPFPVAVKAGLFIILFALAFKKPQWWEKVFWFVFAVTFLSIWSNFYNAVADQIKHYLFSQSEHQAGTPQLTLHFLNTITTVREAGRIDFELFAERISAHRYLWWISLLGIALAALRYHVLVLLIPCLALGFAALKLGLRFTPYAIVPMAFGIVFVIAVCIQKVRPRLMRYVLLFSITTGVFYVNFQKIRNIDNGAFMGARSVEALRALDKITGTQDYVVSWWDYGHAFRYYTNTNVLTDGGLPSGGANFPVSFALTTDSQAAAANIIRIAVEHARIKRGELKGVEDVEKYNFDGGYIQYYMDRYGFKNPEEFLYALKDNKTPLPGKSSEVYFVIPEQIMDIFGTVQAFSGLDLLTGQAKETGMMFGTKQFKEDGKMIFFPQNIRVDKSTWKLYWGEKDAPIRRLLILKHVGNELQIQQKEFEEKRGATLVYAPEIPAFFVMDERNYNSVFTQLFLLESPDPRYFEAVVISPTLKAYRLKV